MGKDGGFAAYPKQVFLILGNEFCERFSFYGMKAILVVFLVEGLRFKESNATSLYHGFNMACYFTPIFGSMLADGLLGKYRTILYISIIYVFGNVVMALAAIPFTGVYYSWLTFLGLMLIGVGTGGIKPCVNAFGADQFDDHQSEAKDSFFSMFYMSINMGSLLSTVLTPLLRNNVTCFGNDCYALAFGVPAALMLVALALFAMGTRWYKVVPPGNNVLAQMIGVVATALHGRITRQGEPRDHWVDYADVKYGAALLADVKLALRVMFMFLTFPVFWALYDQQGSRWILQAGEMDGDIGFFTIPPDLMPVMNPILVLLLVPTCEGCLYPLLERCGVCRTSLQKVGVGMALCALSFVATGFLQVGINNSGHVPVAPGHVRLQLINTSPCDVTVVMEKYTQPIDMLTPPAGHKADMDFLDLDSYEPEGRSILLEFRSCVVSGQKWQDLNYTTQLAGLNPGETYPILISRPQQQEGRLTTALQNQTDRLPAGQTGVMVMNALPDDVDIRLYPGGRADDNPNSDGLLRAFVPVPSLDYTHAQFIQFPAGTIYVDVRFHTSGSNYTKEGWLNKGTVKGKAGALNMVIITGEHINTSLVSSVALVGPNTVPILLQLPQYFIMTLSEVFFIITGMNFAYAQAPITMKAVLQAALLMTSTFGNLIVVIISGAQMADRVFEFFLFSGLMAVTTGVFAIMAHFYTYIEVLAEPDVAEVAQGGADEEMRDVIEYDSKMNNVNFSRSESQESQVRSRRPTGTSIYGYYGEAACTRL